MRKILILTILSFLLSVTSSKSQIRRNDDVQISPVLLGVVAGGSFILMGALQQPDEKWIESPDGNFYNMGQKGYWRNETFWEDRNRVAAVMSGVLLMGLSIKINIK